MSAKTKDPYHNQWATQRQQQISTPDIRFVAACHMPIKPVAWLVESYIEEDALTVMYGPPGKGKSFVALDLSCCIASGMPFHGHLVKPGVVIYIAGEGHNGIARRLHAWAQHNDTALPELLFVTVFKRSPRARGKPKKRRTNYWRLSMANGWTPERRARQAELIRQWRPWEQSTGPRSAEGKAAAARNAWTGGIRPLLRELAEELREQDKIRREILD